MARLRALRPARRILAAGRTRVRQVMTGRLRGVARRPLGLALQLRDPSLLPRDPRRQRLDLRDQPLVLRRELHQHPSHDIAALVIDGVRLSAIHTP